MNGKHVVTPAPHGNDGRSSYAFVMNILSLGVLDRYDLAPGHTLRQASPEEVERIKDTLEHLGGIWNPQLSSWWECRWPHPGGIFERLPQEQWRYFVISFEGPNYTVNALQEAMNVAPVELDIAFTFLGDLVPNGHAFTWNPGRLFHTLENLQRNSATFFRAVTEPDLATISSLHTDLVAHDPALIDVRRLATQVGGLNGFPHDSPLRFLGYFAVLESLLTHAPKPSDPYDSITRQVKKKVILLDHRWNPKLDYAGFGNASVETIWSRMYKYRSLLAHGGAPQFVGELALLRDHDRALTLLRDATRALIRQAIAEPQFLLDLRDC